VVANPAEVDITTPHNNFCAVRVVIPIDTQGNLENITRDPGSSTGQ
jgi:hypothetical protein